MAAPSTLEWKFLLSLPPLACSAAARLVGCQNRVLPGHAAFPSFLGRVVFFSFCPFCFFEDLTDYSLLFNWTFTLSHMYLQRGLDISAQWSIVRTQPSRLPLPLSVQEKYKEMVAGLTASGHQSGQLAVTLKKSGQG